jgi:hypothetical protein
MAQQRLVWVQHTEFDRNGSDSLGYIARRLIDGNDCIVSIVQCIGTIKVLLYFMVFITYNETGKYNSNVELHC